MYRKIKKSTNHPKTMFLWREHFALFDLHERDCGINENRRECLQSPWMLSKQFIFQNVVRTVM